MTHIKIIFLRDQLEDIRQEINALMERKNELTNDLIQELK